MVQGTVTRWVPTAALLLAALLTVSCQRSGRPAASAPPAGSAGTGGATTAIPNPTPPPAVTPPAPTAGQKAALPGQPPAGQKPVPGAIVLQPQAGATPSKGLASAGSLLAVGRDGRVLPEDFKIGPLGDVQAADKGQEQAVQAAGQFLTALAGGKVDKDLISEDARDSMAGTLGFGLSRGDTPKSWRLGRPRTRADGEVTAAVRLFGQKGTSEGEIYVARTGSKWLVSDLQISLADLAVASEKPKEKFLPLDYRWLLEQ